MRLGGTDWDGKSISVTNKIREKEGLRKVLTRLEAWDSQHKLGKEKAKDKRT